MVKLRTTTNIHTAIAFQEIKFIQLQLDHLVSYTTTEAYNRRLSYYMMHTYYDTYIVY